MKYRLSPWLALPSVLLACSPNQPRTEGTGQPAPNAISSGSGDVLAAIDTSKPAIPSLSYPDDADFVVASTTAPGVMYYRRLMGVGFFDFTSGATVRGLLSKYQANIAGGMPYTGIYILKFPDPGPTIDSLIARREQLEAEPGVKYVLLLTSQDGPPGLDAR
jgi:hypothetical protein